MTVNPRLEVDEFFNDWAKRVRWGLLANYFLDPGFFCRRFNFRQWVGSHCYDRTLIASILLPVRMVVNNALSQAILYQQHLPGQLVSINFRHLNVCENQSECPGAALCLQLITVGSDCVLRLIKLRKLHSQLFELLSEPRQLKHVIVYDENLRAAMFSAL